MMQVRIARIRLVAGKFEQSCYPPPENRKRIRMSGEPERDDYVDLVRFRNDGEDFHVLWTARRALRILAPTSTLVAVAVEGVSARDRYLGKQISAGLLVADTVEYYGDERFDAAQQVIVNQLKYSTTSRDDPWPWGGLEGTLQEFATRFRALVRTYGVRQTLAKARFRFVTNRPISANVLAAISAGLSGTGAALKGYARSAFQKLELKTGLEGRRLRQFLSTVEFRAGEPSLSVQMGALAHETTRLQPVPPDTSTARLKELIRTLGTSREGHDPVVRIETVLRTFGLDNPSQLLPAPAHFEEISNPVARLQDAELAEAIRTAEAPLLVTAPGGVGKSVTAQRIPALLPEGSEVILFDGFAGGGYRAPSEARHRHDVGIVEIANELAGRGLCEVLLPTSAPRHQYLRALRDRLVQASQIVGSRNAEALVVIVLDAADNSVFAAGLQRDECFVSDLMMEAPPVGCRIVALARPNRTDELIHPGQPPAVLLRPFELSETEAFVARYQTDAPSDEVAAFHRLTFGNPRVQAYQLALADLTAAVDALGPHGQTVDAMIESQLLAGLELVRSLQPEADVDALCTALAALPPLVPMDVLARVANVEPSAIESFAADFAGGRPLLLSGASLQFRDEPVEEWFIKRFMPDASSASTFADRIASIAERDSYAALALPQLLERSGRHEELLKLALGDGGDFDADPIERRHVTLHRVRFALKSAFARGAIVEVAKLLIRAGEEVAANERQSEFLAANADLVANLAGPTTVDDFVYRRRAAGAWYGSANAYNAAMLAATPAREVESRTYLALAERWLDEWVRSPEEERRNHPLEAPDLAAIAFTYAVLESADAMGDFLKRPRDAGFRFTIASIALQKLLDIERLDLVEQTFARAPDAFTRLAACTLLRTCGIMPACDAVNDTSKLLAGTEFPPGLDSYDRRDSHASLMTFAESAARCGLRDEARSILDRSNWSISDHPFPDVSGRIALGLRATALRCVLDDAAPDPTAIWRSSHPNAAEDARPGAEFSAILELLLPTYLLRANVLVGRVADIDERLNATRAARGSVGFHSYHEREMRGMRFLAEIELLQAAGALTPTSLASAENALSAGEHGPFPHESRFVIRLIAGDVALHADALRLAAGAAEINELEHEDASSKARAYSDLARALLPISRDEATSYFLRGIETVDRVGEEMHERLFMLLGLSHFAGAGAGASAEDCYRLLRIAEVYAAINDHKFPWNSVADAGQSLHASAALATASRLDSRGVVHLTRTLPDMLERLLNAKQISLQTATAFHVLGGVWDFHHLTELLADLTADQRQAVLGDLGRDMIDERHEAWHMRTLVAAAREHGLLTPYLEAIYEQRQVREQRNSGGVGAIALGRDPTPPFDPSTIFDSHNLLTPTGIADAYASWRSADIGWRVSEFGEAMRARVAPADWAAHISATVANDAFGVDDIAELLSAAAEQWSVSASVRDRVKSAVEKLIEDRAVELAATTYLWKEHLPRLAELAGRDVADLVARIAEHAGPHITQFGSSSLFALAHRFAEGLLSADEALEVLRFAFERFERILRPSDGDGHYTGALAPPATLEGTLAGLLWVRLGDPDREKRWRATHVIRRLARAGETGLVAELVKSAEMESAGAYLTTGFPFYFRFARLHLLIALARAALESPAAIAPHRAYLAQFATRAHAHIFERYYSGQALTALHRAGTCPADKRELEEWRNLLVSSVARQPSSLRTGLATDDEGNTQTVDERAYYLPHDLDKEWGRPIARCFGLGEVELRRRVADAITTDLGAEINRRWDNDPRSKHGIYRQYGRYRVEQETLSEYQAESGIAIALGRLLDERGLQGDYGEDSLSDLLDERLLVRRDGTWLSDRRDPTPPSSRTWIGGEYERDWLWNIVASDFHAMLFAHEDRFCVAGDWTESDHYKTESIEVSSALVRPELADDLLRACQIGSRRSYFALPNDQWSRRVAGPRFALTSWVAHPDRLYGIDQDDPLAGSIRLPTLEPGRVIKRIFSLSANVDGREWAGSGLGSDVVLSSRVWGEPPLLRDDDKPAEGQVLLADLDVVCRMLEGLHRSLIVRVTIRRRDSFTRDKDVDYAPPYTRYFVLEASGELRWLRGSGPARESAG
jgi:hypothetical protein